MIFSGWLLRHGLIDFVVSGVEAKISDRMMPFRRLIRSDLQWLLVISCILVKIFNVYRANIEAQLLIVRLVRGLAANR
jgi:hypothetical protein